MLRITVIVLLLYCTTVNLRAGEVPASGYFEIMVRDAETSRGIPMVQLIAPSGISFWTDSAGRIALDDPALMNRKVGFEMRSHGYTCPEVMGLHGVVLDVKPGAKAEVQMTRLNIAQRLYRITGPDIYLDSMLLRYKSPISQPVLNGGVMGQDSACCCIYKNRYFWIWGDTTNSGHFLTSNYQSTGATSAAGADRTLNPEQGIDLHYFTKDDFVRPMVDMPERGVYWLSGLVAVDDQSGKERLLANYARIKPPMTTIERGQLLFDDKDEVFRPIQKDDMNAKVEPDGHAVAVNAGTTESSYILFAGGTKFTRAAATFGALSSRSAYEAFTCLKAGSRYTSNSAEILDRDAGGNLVFSWKHDTSPTGQSELRELESNSEVKPGQQWFALRDVNTGKPILQHALSLAYNPYRGRWTMIVSELMGTSMLGETWYAEADRAEGPYAFAQKIISHDQYTFYNPLQHSAMSPDGGKTILFEGTYTATFSGSKCPTPRYDYNQIMYELDLADERLKLPVPVYRENKRGEEYYHTIRNAKENRVADIAFYACDAPRPGMIPIRSANGGSRIINRKGVAGTVLFYAFTNDTPTTPGLTAHLIEKQAEQGRFTYALDENTSRSNHVDGDICVVWKSPFAGLRFKSAGEND
jgi:hypothetical protein